MPAKKTKRTKKIQEKSHNVLLSPVHPHLGWLTTASIAMSSFLIMITVLAQGNAISQISTQNIIRTPRYIAAPSPEPSLEIIQENLDADAEIAMPEPTPSISEEGDNAQTCDVNGTIMPGTCENYQWLLQTEPSE